MSNTITKEEIEKLLPHREPMLLIDKLINIVPLKSATAIVKVKSFIKRKRLFMDNLKSIIEILFK